MDKYLELRRKEDEHINFFCDMVHENFDGLESMVFSQKYLDSLKENEQTLQDKENSNYFRSKITDAALCDQINEVWRVILLATN